MTPAPAVAHAPSPPPMTTGVPVFKPVASLASRVTSPSTSVEAWTSGSSRSVEADRVDQVCAPGALREIEKIAAGGVGIIGGAPAGEFERDEIFRAEKFPGLPVEIGLMLLDPQDFRREVSGTHAMSRAAIDILRPAPCPDRFGLLDGALIGPDDGRAQRLPGRVDRHDAHHLPAEGDGGNVGRIDASRVSASSARVEVVTARHQSIGSCSAQPACA